MNVEFQKEELVSSIMVDTTYHKIPDEEMKDQLRYEMHGYVFSQMADTKEFEVEIPAPSIPELVKSWLFDKNIKLKVVVKAKDILLNPPQIKDKTIRMYVYEPPILKV